MKHKVIRVNNLMYRGCEPHWGCTICGDAVPFHCYKWEEYAKKECPGGVKYNNPFVGSECKVWDCEQN